MDIVIRADQPIRVTGDGFEPRIVAGGETTTFTSPTGNISVAQATVEQMAPPPVTDDVFSPGNRPNGAVTAGIAPKMPKSSGELVQIVEPNGRVVERAAADIGVATQGGGPESTDGTTPGPQPQPADAPTGAGLASATGDVDERGRPVARTVEAVSSPPAPSDGSAATPAGSPTPAPGAVPPAGPPAPRSAREPAPAPAKAPAKAPRRSATKRR